MGNHIVYYFILGNPFLKTNQKLEDDALLVLEVGQNLR
jgi:hypothetical protein